MSMWVQTVTWCFHKTLKLKVLEALNLVGEMVDRKTMMSF